MRCRRAKVLEKGNGYQQKEQKSSQNGQNRALNGKSVKKSMSTKSKSTKVKVKDGAKIEEILNGPTQVVRAKCSEDECKSPPYERVLAYHEMSATVERRHDGDGGGDDPSHSPPRPIGTGCRCVGGRKAIRGGMGGGRDGGRKGLRKETRNLGLKKSVDEYGPLKIRFEYNNKGTMLHVGPNAARWSNLVGELAREFPMYYPSWHSIEKSKRVHIMRRLMQNFDLTPHMRSMLWSDIEKDIEQHFAKVYTDNKSYLKRTYWSVKPSETRDVETSNPDLPRTYDSHNRISILTFGLTLSMLPGPLKMLKTGLPEEMLRLRDLGANTPSGVPYTEEILALVRNGKQRGNIPEVDARPRDVTIEEAKEEAKWKGREIDLLRRVVTSDDRMSQMLSSILLGAGDLSPGKVRLVIGESVTCFQRKYFPSQQSQSG
ncbi:hypothetical protein Tco_1105697 [Tanacetum coccineum]